MQQAWQTLPSFIVSILNLPQPCEVVRFSSRCHEKVTSQRLKCSARMHAHVLNSLKPLCQRPRLHFFPGCQWPKCLLSGLGTCHTCLAVDSHPLWDTVVCGHRKLPLLTILLQTRVVSLVSACGPQHCLAFFQIQRLPVQISHSKVALLIRSM